MAEETTGQETGNHEASFTETLPEDLRAEPSLANFKDVGSLAKSYVHAQKLVGRDKLPLPKDETDELGWNEVYSRLGRPEKAEDYQLGNADAEKDGFTVDGTIMGKFKAAAHEAGLTAKQAESIMNFNLDFIRETKAQGAVALDRQYDTAVAELRKEYGATYEAKIGLASRALKHFGGEDVVATLERMNLDNDPNIVRMFAKIGEHIGEDRFGAAEAGLSGMTPAEARGKIANLKLDAKFMGAYTDRYHVGHAEAVAQMQELFKYAYPS